MANPNAVSERTKLQKPLSQRFCDQRITVWKNAENAESSELVLFLSRGFHNKTLDTINTPKSIDLDWTWHETMRQTVEILA